jgi:hypothetical protein
MKVLTGGMQEGRKEGRKEEIDEMDFCVLP